LNNREKEFGRLHGLLPRNIKERFPIEYAARERDGKYWYRFPGGENYPDVEMRLSSFIEKISRQYPGRSLLIVTHQGMYIFTCLLPTLFLSFFLSLFSLSPSLSLSSLSPKISFHSIQ
jgi:broad specificity phosphatase PhoE